LLLSNDEGMQKIWLQDSGIYRVPDLYLKLPLLI